jgi:hypothetical protein
MTTVNSFFMLNNIVVGLVLATNVAYRGRWRKLAYVVLIFIKISL